jgi:hypothetical protein
LAVWILVGIVPNAMSQEEAREEKKTGAAAYDDFKEPYRTQLVGNWKQAVEAAKQNVATIEAELKREAKEGLVFGGGPDAEGRYHAYSDGSPVISRVLPKSSAGKRHILETRSRLKKAKAELAELRRNNPPLITLPALPDGPLDWRPGDMGSLEPRARGSVWLVEKLGKDKMVIAVANRRGGRQKPVMLSGFSTEGLTNGEPLSLYGLIKVVGDATYTNMYGGRTPVVTAVKAESSDCEACIASMRRAKP